jgi:outer membrane protein TolC
MRKLLWIAILLIASSVSLFSLEIITRKQALETVLLKNNLLSYQEYVVKQAEYEHETAKSQLKPDLSLKNEFTRSDEPSISAFSKISQGNFTPVYMASMDNPDLNNNFKTSLTLSMPLWHGGQIREYIKIAKLNVDVKKFEYERKKRELISQTIKSYENIIVAESYLQVAENSLKTAYEELRIINDMKQAGLAVDSDVIRAELHVAESEEFLIQSQNNLNLTRYNLLFIMGYSDFFDFNIEGKLDKKTCSSLSYDELRKTALENRNDLKALKKEFEKVSSVISKLEKEKLPEISMFADYSLNSSKDFSNGEGEGKTIGIVSKLKLYDSGKNKAEINQYKASHKALQNLIDNMENFISLEVKTIFLNRETASKKIEVAAKSVSQAEENYKIIQNRYRQGLIPYVSVIDAQSMIVKSQTRLINSIYEFNICRENMILATEINE